MKIKQGKSVIGSFLKIQQPIIKSIETALDEAFLLLRFTF